MKKVKVAFFDAKKYDIEVFNELNEKYKFEIKYIESHLNSEMALLAKDCNVVCAFVNDIIDEKTIKVLAKLKIELIALRCSGYNNVDLKTAYKRIHIVRVPAYSPHAIAEHAVAMILTLNRKIHRAYYRTKEGNFSIDGLLGFNMYEKVAGIIGTGRIGKETARILKGFGMNVLLYDKYPDENFAKENKMKYVGLDYLLKNSNVISLHCPLNDETFHLINRKTIRLMKNSVMIINTGRGSLINTKDLIDGLKSGKIGYAGLDVYEEEDKYFFEDYSTRVISDDILARLLTFPNVLITSHQAYFTNEAVHNIANDTLENIRSYFVENRLENEICYFCGKDCIKEKTGRCF